MLKDTSILENFDLVEELDDESAALYSGGLSGTWQLKTIGGESVLSGNKITASFKDGQVSGKACNSYSASYETKGKVEGVGQLKVGLIISTAEACVGPGTNQYGEYFNALKDASSYTITNDLLILSGSETLVYEPS